MSVLGGTAFKLRSSTHNDPYASLEFEACTGYTAGDIVTVGDVTGVVVGTVVSGKSVVVVYQAAKILVPCVEVTSGNLAEFQVGCKVYADVANNEVTPVAGALNLCGIVVVAAAVGDETVLVHWMGALEVVA